ncbi:hypothetical protein GCM10010399_88750 [Dactylosporangium fulvum]|uniref:NAD(P)-binding domain-containing protein n=1 Tax=Dactylosporangium fulvum TaxID=53359 RepID=A0ABY5VSA7_9ACTN|nr:hypothetical protein [Dactylosporangium fulvum]UWP80633.1 hypothetical protein Dfulv_36555 [Dactylosporangium fulvum]
MTALLLFGANGRAGRRIAEEAGRRGLPVTAARYGDDLPSGHDVAISTVYSATADPRELYVDGTRTLLADLERAGVGRLLIVGLVTTLQPDLELPESFRPFALARAAELEVLAAYRGPVDWLVCTPPLDLVADESGAFKYADLATAVLDEVVRPSHHRAQYAVKS